MSSKKKITLLFPLLFIAAFVFAIISGKDDKEKIIFKPNDDYATYWKKVDSLANKGLNKSALEMVSQIYEDAKVKNKADQAVKALLYKMRFTSYIEEDAAIKIINELQEETASSAFPLKPLLHSLLAEMYWRYYEQNRYKIYKRTTTVNFDESDIATWNLNKLLKETIKHYQLSLQNEENLKSTSLNFYDEIITKGDSLSRKYRPTLYDFVAHRAIDFYSNEESNITSPVYQFTLSSEKYFATSKEFTGIKIETKDSLSLKYYAITNLQKLIAFHVNDANPSALIDVDLKRLKFVRSNANLQQKDSLYLAALQWLSKAYSEHPASAEVDYAIAQYHLAEGNKYNAQTASQFQWEKKKALEICEATLKKFPKTIGAKNCETQKQYIIRKSFSFKTEEVNSPNKPFRALLTHTNTDSVFIKVASVDIDKFRSLRKKYNSEELIEYYNGLSELKKWPLTLQNEGDYQSHSVEIKIPELPSGLYVILASSNKNFDTEETSIAYTTTWLSDIAYINRDNNKTGEQDFYVLHRDEGYPLAGAKAQVWYEKYNYKSRNYEQIKGELLIADADGHFVIPSANDYRNFEIEFSYQNQRLYSESFYQYKPYDQKQTAYTQTFFFGDRAIYRPGQTIYFKGIVLNREGEKNSIKTNHSTTVQLLDANYQKVAEQTFTTNEYGTFNGSFILSTGVMTGQMQLKNESGFLYFSVEEYKRPKFEVNFEPVKGSYKLDQEVNVKGLAKAFSGAMLSDAQVKYRVVRKATYPYWRWWWGAYPSSGDMEITNGTLTTNEEGEFEILFKALADANAVKTQRPMYNFTIYADVTDLNGETHSAQQNVMVSYQALVISTTIPALLNKEDKNTFAIETTNLNGEKESVQGNMVIHKLKVPDKIVRKRLWEMPDQFVMSKQDYEAAFPNDEFANENQMQNWPNEKKMLEQEFNTSKTTDLKLDDLSKWPAGVYKYEMRTKDKFGEEISLENYFTVFSPNDKQVPDNSTDWFVCTKDNGELGEMAEFVIGTKENNVKVMYEIEHKGSIISKQWLTLTNEQKKISIPIEEKYRGGFVIKYAFLKHNRLYAQSQFISVPFTNKELDISFETFRNKLQPGEKEEWKIKIKGKNGDKVAAEMLATLYDASLDEFKSNYWNFNFLPYYYLSIDNYSGQSFSYNTSYTFKKKSDPYHYFITPIYDQLNWFGFSFYGGGYYKASMTYREGEKKMSPMKDKSSGTRVPEEALASGGAMLDDVDDVGIEPIVKSAPAPKVAANGQAESKMSEIKMRSNFNETAFFYPQLQTNENGEVIISFTIPESLTKWKMLGFAHTKDLRYGFATNELVTQKEIMVVPNAPRFFRENDKIEFTAKISNLSEKDLAGKVDLQFYDALSMKEISSKMIAAVHGTFSTIGERDFEVKKTSNTVVKWEVMIPEGISAISYKIVAKADKFADGEEMVIPVLTNRMLVTESMPLPIRGNQTKTFSFEKLKNSGSSSTLKHHQLTLEFTSNPAWYAVQSLPYLMEYPYECSEQVFSRFYANSLATHIANSNPKIKQVFDSWKNYDSKALLSNLEKNEELKSVLLEETPWVLNAQNESERKKRVALLFDLNKMSAELELALKKLQQAQVSNGGWPWFKGMPDDRYITQHIVCGFGHLDKLGVKNIREEDKTWNMIQDAVAYMDNRMREDYEDLKKYKVDLKKNNLSQLSIHYLYTRSYFADIAVSTKNKEAYTYFIQQANQYWLENTRYLQAMIALSLHRLQTESKTPSDIVKSLKENAIYSDEMGMYWKEFNAGYYWYQAPIESQALMVEVFNEVANDKKLVDELRVWLLKQKQTQDWKTTKATVEACYALLLSGTDWLATEPNVIIQLGNIKIDPLNDKDLKTEAGTGYFKTSWNKEEIKPEMGNITVSKSGEGVGWGAVYWQYFEQLDKITPHETPLKLEKKLFLEQNTDAGPIITPINEKTNLKPGDRVKVRIELRVDRLMEYVHMKDMRASCFEPENVFSTYKYQDGLGYYESTRDVSTNFFFSYLPRGTYVFEYPLLVTHKGDFSNGISSIQCMYAPEFSSHSEGIRVKVK